LIADVLPCRQQAAILDAEQGDAVRSIYRVFISVVERRFAMAPERQFADAQRVACEVCLREVPRSEAVVPEASDYVAYFCGLECFAKWKALREFESKADAKAT
jgi:hypothetical protein